MALSKLQTQGNWLAALSEDPTFDLDLTLDSMDLAELASAMTTQPKMSGQASGSLEVHGTPASLEGKSAIHLRDFIFGNEPRTLRGCGAQAAPGTVNLKATATARAIGSSKSRRVVSVQAGEAGAGLRLATDGPISATLNFPAIFLSKLPLYLSRRMFVDGILSGRLAISDSLHHPQLRGAAHLINGRLLGGTSLSTSITFGGQTATIDFAQIAQKSMSGLGDVRGEIDFRDLADIRMKIFPTQPVIALTLLEPGDCIDQDRTFSQRRHQPAFPGRSLPRANRRNRFPRRPFRAELDDFVERKAPGRSTGDASARRFIAHVSHLP